MTKPIKYPDVMRRLEKTAQKKSVVDGAHKKREERNEKLCQPKLEKRYIHW